jgi:hypothetical protein
VYWLDWWEPALGGREGTIGFGHWLMPAFVAFVAVGTIAFGVATAFQRWIGGERRNLPEVIRSAALAGVLSIAIPFLFAVANRDREHYVPTLVWALFVAMVPTAIGAGTLAIAKRRRRRTTPARV